FTAALHEAGGCYLSVVDAGTVLCQPLAEKPDAGSELFLSRDRNENICTCTGHGLSAGSCGTGSHAGRAGKPGVKLAGADKWKMPCPAGNAYC
ncbi:fimbrial protein, partial [Salmonella enterica subsp. enterica serovar Oranienburg]|nr:fimbrial protein [Salmonella enterica subsp. enterica serovar Oranienburg]